MVGELLSALGPILDLIATLVFVCYRCDHAQRLNRFLSSKRNRTELEEWAGRFMRNERLPGETAEPRILRRLSSVCGLLSGHPLAREGYLAVHFATSTRERLILLIAASESFHPKAASEVRFAVPPEEPVSLGGGMWLVVRRD